MRNKIILSFIFEEAVRSQLVFSNPAKIRLNTENKADPRLMLKAQSDGKYPTDSDLYVRTGQITPNALKQWLKFEAVYKEAPQTLLLPAGTSLGFKVFTTGGDYWWDGSSWAVAGASDWNTEAEINANLATFPLATIGNKSIGFKVNLKTTDPNVTPEVKELKLLGDFDVEWMEDIVYDGVIRKLNTEFRSSSVLAFQVSGPTSALDLAAVLDNKGYNITGIRSVYNLTDDPMKLTNLFLSYAPGAAKQDGFTFASGVVTVSSPIPDAKIVEVTFEYVPEIVVMVDQDYYEPPAYPCIVMETIQVLDRPGFTMRDTNSFGHDVIRDKTALRAFTQIAPKQHSIRFQFAAFTNKQLDQMRLMDDLTRFFSEKKTLRTWALDYECGMQIVEEFDSSKNQSAADTSNTNIAEGSFDVLGVLNYHKQSIEEPLVGVGQVNVDAKVVR